MGELTSSLSNYEEEIYGPFRSENGRMRPADVMEAVDTDGDGYLSLGEVTIARIHRRLTCRCPRLILRFNYLKGNDDKSTSISVAELKENLPKLASDGPKTRY